MRLAIALVAALVAACGGAQAPTLQGSQQDTDRDGVRDIDDKCAYDPGPGTRDGCPEKESTITVTGGQADRPDASVGSGGNAGSAGSAGSAATP